MQNSRLCTPCIKSFEKNLPFQIRRTLVQALLLPHFNNGDIVLTNLTSYLLQRLQRVHNACVLLICNNSKYDHVSPSFEALSWLRLQKRRYIQSLVLLYNILKTPTQVDSPLSSFHDLSTRSRHDPISSMSSIELHSTHLPSQQQ